MRWGTFLVAFVVIGLALVGRASAQDALDCAGYTSQAEAQAAYRADPTDPAGNDADNDGIACELFAYDDPAVDFTPVIGAGITATVITTATTTATVAATTTTVALPSTGAGAPLGDGVAGGIAAALVVALLGVAGGCGALVLRGQRRG